MEKIEKIVLTVGFIFIMFLCVEAFTAQTKNVNLKVVSINKTWQGDNSPFENVTLSDGRTTVFSCDYYQVNSTISYQIQTGWFLFWYTNTKIPLNEALGC